MTRHPGTIARTCETCGATFHARPFAVKAGKARFCSQACAGRRRWRPQEDEQIRAMYPDLPTPEVARRLRRSLAATYARARLLGVEKSAAYLASPDACRLRRGDLDSLGGVKFRFPKGHVRRPGWGPGRMKETQFKKGQRSGKAAEHVMPIGSTRLIDGYVYRKVSEVSNVSYTVNWRPEHHLLWISVHGPIPPGHVLRFKNGDKTDVRLDNLELITRRQLMARNTVHNLPPELDKTIQLLGALNRQIRKRTTSHEKQDRRSA